MSGQGGTYGDIYDIKINKINSEKRDIILNFEI